MACEIDQNGESKKHKNSETEPVPKKKARKFSGKDLRNLLKGNGKSNVLQGFLDALKTNESEDVALEYLENGGSLQELLKCLEYDVSPALVLDIANILLMKIMKGGWNYQDETYKSCEDFLKTSSALIDKMLGLSSSNNERIVMLKFLTTMATNSSQLTKDILTYVNFNLSRMKFLSLTRAENTVVRRNLVYFLTAILIDIEYSILSLLLSRPILSTILPGLIYDDVETVCFLITAMKTNILEKNYKSLKMKVFNTIMLKEIVNLYNWKGTGSLKPMKGEAPVVEVNEVKKAKVSRCVHEFLIELCTSHKNGIIFKDPMVGIGQKSHNKLLNTVVESMDSFWAHSYASDLIIKICRACPDITKRVWMSVKSPLEPRTSTQWLVLANFVKRLLRELEPACLKPYINNLTTHQICTVITTLVAPIPVLKVIVPENGTYGSQSVKYQVFLLIFEILKSVNNYLSACKTWLDEENYKKLRSYLRIYIERNFPTGEKFLEKWNIDSKAHEDTSFNFLKYLSVIFDIFESYIELSPDSLYSVNFSQNDLQEFLSAIKSKCGHYPEKDKELLQAQVIDVFLTFNPDLFSLETKSFNFFLSVLLEICYKNTNEDNLKIYSVLRKLLKHSGPFEDFKDRDIDIWISGIFSLKSYNDTISNFITDSLKLAKLKTKEYLTEFYDYQESIESDNCPTSNFNPMIFAVLEHSATIDADKYVSSYLNFVIPNFIFQSDYRVISLIVEKSDSLNISLRVYINSVTSDTDFSFEIPKILRIFGKENVFRSFNEAIVTDSFESFLNKQQETTYSNLPLDLLQMGLFYLSRSIATDNAVKMKYSKNLVLYVNNLLEKQCFDCDFVLGNPWFIQNFSILDRNSNGDLNCCTNFVIDFVTCYTKKYEITDTNMKYFHKKILKMVTKILKNPKKYEDFDVVKVLDIFKLTSEMHIDILNKIAECITKNLDKYKCKVFCSVLNYSMEKYCQFDEDLNQFLPKETLDSLFEFYMALNQDEGSKTFELSKNFLTYFTKFPDHVKYIGTDIVKSIISLREYHKENTDLIVFILKRRDDLITCIDDKLEDVLFVKGILYPVLQVLCEKYSVATGNEKNWFKELFSKMYNNLEEVLHKTLKKPQKASQHLDHHYQGICLLLDLYFEKDKFQEYVSKVLKFEVTKIFHVQMLNTIFRKFLSSETDNSLVTNTILTFIHLLLNVLKRLSKTEENIEETLNAVSDILMLYINDLIRYQEKFDFNTIKNNESFKSIIKFFLKYGVSDHEKLLELLRIFIMSIGKNFDVEQVESIMEMLLSHSEFLNVLLVENHKCKKGILSLMTVICESWPKFMSRNHIPILLSSYRATMTETDRMTFKLIKMYESKRDDVCFHDFRPYLWGNDGAVHYSVRIDIGKAILKQPKIKDVLNILQENIVEYTIKNYSLYTNDTKSEDLDASKIYDLDFLIPLFIYLLSPENVIQTYQFAKCGALSLAILGLSSSSKNMRAATCNVLSRYHSHLESKQTGKDNFLYVKLIEAICMWMSNSESQMNNFASIFLARTALILSKPSQNNVMLPQLSKYLVVKHTLDFSTIPELYTYLGSSDVEYQQHLQFILEILRDGLIDQQDFKIFTKSMALKRLMELYSCKMSTTNIKLNILDVILSLCRLDSGVKLMCVYNSLLQIFIMDLEELVISKEPDHALLAKIKLVISRISLNSGALDKVSKMLLKKVQKRFDITFCK